MEQTLMTVEEAAQQLRVSPDTIRRLLRDQQLHGMRVGGQWRVPIDAVRAFAIPEDVREYLREEFGNVKDEPSPSPNHYAFSVELSSGETRTLTVHRDVFIFANLIRAYMRDHHFAEQLRNSNVEITKPLRSNP